MRDHIFIKVERQKVDPKTGEITTIALTSQVKKDLFKAKEVSDLNVKEELNVLESLILEQLNQVNIIKQPQKLEKKEEEPKTKKTKKISKFAETLKKK